MMLDPGRNEVPREGSNFNLLRERVCTSLSINTWGLDWTHLKSLAVNERDCEVTRLYRAIIICLGGGRGRRSGQKWPGTCEVQRLALTPYTLNYSGSVPRQVSHAGRGGIEPQQAPVGWSRWSMHRLISPSVQFLKRWRLSCKTLHLNWNKLIVSLCFSSEHDFHFHCSLRSVRMKSQSHRTRCSLFHVVYNVTYLWMCHDHVWRSL